MLNCRYGIIGIVGGWLTSEVFDILERDFRELIIRETGDDKFTFDKSSAVSILESCTLFIISIWGAVSPKVSNRAFGNSSVPLTSSR